MRQPLDGRTAADIYEALRTLAAAYVPEWNFGGETDPATALTRVFSELFADTLERYDKMPYKHQLFLLNLLGAKRLPSLSAQGSVTVDLQPGDYPGVRVKRGARLYRQDGARVLYETTAELFAANSRLARIYCSDSRRYRVVRPYDGDAATPAPFQLFDFARGQNLQRFGLHLAEEYALHTPENATVELAFFHRDNPARARAAAQLLSDPKTGVWRYRASGGWLPVEQVEAIDNRVRLRLRQAIARAPHLEDESHWLSFAFAPRPPDAEIAFTELKLASAATLEPDHLYRNDQELDARDFLPFGEQFGPYDDFYLASDVAFSKPGATIALDFSVDTLETGEAPPPAPPPRWKSILPKTELQAPETSPVSIAEVSWTYWNGHGWARLDGSERWPNVFQCDDKTAAHLTFHCPADMREAEIGAHTGKWLRVRIVKTDRSLGSAFRYHAPRIGHIEIRYAYEAPAAQPQALWLEAHLEQTRLPLDGVSEIRLLERPKTGCPSVWFAFRKPLRGGPVRIAFQRFGKTLAAPPALRWEYYGKRNGTSRWIELQVADETGHFAESGIVSFFCNEPMEPRRLFGETACWLRAVDVACRYEDEREPRPTLVGVRLNTVAIRQQETRQSEYFSVARGEKNKLCRLSAGNLTAHTVWVNERGALRADALLRPPAMPQARVTRDAQGRVAEYWLPWQRVERFASCGPNDRVYRIDEIGGKLLFGDGKQGKLPDCTPDAASIRVDYCTGDGARGNCSARVIAAFADPVPFVCAATNEAPVLGGCDAETAEEALRRCARLASSQGRAVSAADIAALLRGADRNIARIKLLLGEPRGGLTVAVLPKDRSPEAGYFAAMRRRILARLAAEAPLTLVAGKSLSVREVDYIEVSLRVAASVASYDDYHDALQAIDGALQRFLDPVGGGRAGRGFAIGELPAKTEIYRCLKAIEGLERIDDIYLRCALLENGRSSEIDPARAAANPCAVPVSGRHEIALTVRPS